MQKRGESKSLWASSSSGEEAFIGWMSSAALMALAKKAKNGRGLAV